MKKKILLGICVLMLTGCKVNYNLTIDKDLTASEEIQMTGTDSFFDVYYKSSKLNIINMMLNTGDRKKTLIDNNYQYEIIEDSTPYVKANKKYNSIKEYLDNTIFYQQYFSNMLYNEDNGIVTIESGNFIPYEPDDIEQYEVNDFTLKINLPFKVIENNAVEFDKKTNSYYWTIKPTDKNCKILLKFDTSKIYNPNLETYLIIGALGLAIIVIWSVYIKFNKKLNRR